MRWGRKSRRDDVDLVAAVGDHLERCFKTDEISVWHELASDDIHIDVFAVPPTPDFRFHRLVTCGMASKPMIAEDGSEVFAELTLALAEDWPLSQDAFEDEAAYWPIGLLKHSARFPHEYSTLLWIGHTIPNGDPPDPYPGTDFCCLLIGPAALVPDGFHKLTVDDRDIYFLSAIPLFQDEMEFKLDKGGDATIDRLAAAGVSDLLDLERPNTCA